MEDISVNTFLCNCISDRTKGGRNQILASEVEEYKEDIIKTIYDNYSTKSFNSFDLISIFSLICYEHDIYSFDRDKLLQYIIDNKEESKYSRILSSIEINYGEHYDESKSLDKAIDALKYVGMLHPDYYKEDTYDYNPYINLAIDNNIRYWLEMGMDKKLKELYPEIIEFVDEYNSVSDNITAGIKNSYRRKK
jgi:hypothetical protein